MQTPPPPPPSAGTRVNCQWCSKPMNSSDIRCSSCGKLRKDIYSDKIKSYTFSALAGLLFALGLFAFKSRQVQYGFYYTESSGNSTLKYICIIAGIISLAAGIYFYVRASQKLKTYWWV